MAITAIFGFETGNPRAESGAVMTGTPTADNSSPRTGTYALKVIATSGAAVNLAVYQGAGSVGYVRFFIKVTARPASTARMIFGDVGGINLRLNPDGTIAYYNTTTLIGTSTTALTDTSAWYMLQVRWATGTSVTILQIDGNIEVTGSPSAWGINVKFGAGDTVADTYTAFYDDVAFATTAVPGTGKAVLLVPVSTNGTTAAKWVDNDGTQTNMYLGAANRPPAGIVAGTTPSHAYIKHTGGAAGTTDKHDANMTTYTSAGIGAGDTINAVSAFVWTGEESGTGSKLISFEVLSNPVIGTSGAVDVFGPSGAQGAWPTNWDNQIPIINAVPGALTLGTSPVMRVVRPETATRVASIAAMYMYVDYTPAVAATKAPPLVGRRPLRMWSRSI